MEKNAPTRLSLGDVVSPLLSAALAAVGAWGALTQRLTVVEERSASMDSRLTRIEAKLDSGAYVHRSLPTE